MEATKTYTIREAAKVSGLPESTLRYYETIGIIQPITRDHSSKHRTYSEDEVNLLVSIACLNATGMSLDNMREYLRNRDQGAQGAAAEIALLTTQKQILGEEAKRLKVRRQYVDLKIAYWQAIEQDNETDAIRIASEASGLVKDLQPARK